MSRTTVGVPLLLFAVATSVPAADLAEIKARGILRAIAGADEAPEMFSFAASGEPGFEREMLEGFARLHGLKVEPVRVANADERLRALDRGTGDLIIGIVETEERKKLVSFTAEVIPVRHVVFSRKPHGVVGTIEEFRAEKVGVAKGTSWAQAAVEAGVDPAQMQQYPDRNAVFEALRRGAITASVITVSDLILAAKQEPELQAGVFLGAPISAGWAVRKSDPQLLAALNQYLGNYRRGPSWNRLVVKYFGEQALTVLGRARQQP